MSEEKKVVNTGGKVKYNPIYDIDVTDNYDIDSVLKSELAERGLEYRWVDFKKTRDNGGVSNGGWILYRRESEDPRFQGIKALADPDGLVRNRSLVLAVKTIRNAEKVRSNIKSQNRANAHFNKMKAEELSNDAAKFGGSAKILAGYDSNK